MSRCETIGLKDSYAISEVMICYAIARAPFEITIRAMERGKKSRISLLRYDFD